MKDYILKVSPVLNFTGNLMSLQPFQRPQKNIKMCAAH